MTLSNTTHARFAPVAYGGAAFLEAAGRVLHGPNLWAPVRMPRRRLRVRNTALIAADPARFDLEARYADFVQIVEDMRQRAGAFEPLPHWHLRNAGQNTSGNRDIDADAAEVVERVDIDLFDQRYGSLRKLLDPYLGSTYMQPVNPTQLDRFEPYLRAVDALGLAATDLATQAAAGGWVVSDLGSLMDVNLILGQVADDRPQPLAVVEVGGGYGRLTEVMLNVMEGKCHYVMLDSVPASLLYSYQYLKRVLPGMRVGSHFAGDRYSSEFHVYIMPSWDIASLPDGQFAVAVNIESFQEMVPHHVSAYLAHFCRLVQPGGLLYLSNAWDYIYREPYQIPSNFETLMLGNTPRSWSPVHPTHILRCTDSDHTQKNHAMIGAFLHA